MGLDGLGDLQVDDLQKCCFIRLADPVDGLEVGQQGVPGFGPDACDVVQLRTERGLATSLAVMLQ